MESSATKEITVRTVCVLLLTFAACCAPSALRADPLDTISLERVKELREVERYQLEVAEKYYREKNWKVAISEYEKFLSLYESSIGAPYVQLKWSLAQCELRKQNTAIKEGFQSVIDYWPESQDAIAAAFYIGHTYKSMGQTKEAKKAYRDVLSKHPKHLAAVYAANDLIDIAGLEKDDPTRIQLWKKLTFDTPRGGGAAGLCQKASTELAVHSFYSGAFAEGVKALETTYPGPQLAPHVVHFIRGPIQTLAAQSDTKAKAELVADAAIAWLKTSAPADLAKPEDKAAAQANWFAVADLQYLAGRGDKVPEVYDEMLKKFGQDDTTLGRIAAWFKQQKRFEDARATYRKYASAAEGVNQVAYSYREEGKPDEAVAAYRQLVAQDPTHVVQHKAEIVATYHAARKFKEAIDVCHELEKDDVANVGRWHWMIATCYKDNGQLAEAIGYFRQCTNLPENLKQMAWCHRQLKQPNEAVGLYNQIVAAYPDSAPWALLQAGYTREEAGETEPAIKTFQQVCKRFPKDGHASQAHAHLQTKYKISVTLGGAKDE
jgi:tetratricopeptide (TPR) repeat protein